MISEAIHRSWKQLVPLSVKKVEERLILIAAQKFANDLHSQDLAVTQDRRWSSLAQRLVFEPVIADTEHTDDKVVRSILETPVIGFGLC